MQRDVNHCRSYATQENLEKALKKLGLNQYIHVIVWTGVGRVTAIFPYHGGCGVAPAHHGFMVIN